MWEYPVLAKLPEARQEEDGTIDFDSAEMDSTSDTREKPYVFLTGGQLAWVIALR